MHRWRVGILFTCPGYRLMEVLWDYRGYGQVESMPPTSAIPTRVPLERPFGVYPGYCTYTSPFRPLIGLIKAGFLAVIE